MGDLQRGVFLPNEITSSEIVKSYERCPKPFRSIQEIFKTPKHAAKSRSISGPARNFGYNAMLCPMFLCSFQDINFFCWSLWRCTQVGLIQVFGTVDFWGVLKRPSFILCSSGGFFWLGEAHVVLVRFILDFLYFSGLVTISLHWMAIRYQT